MQALKRTTHLDETEYVMRPIALPELMVKLIYEKNVTLAMKLQVVFEFNSVTSIIEKHARLDIS